MNLIELHILQSVPVNCINRDQFGSPKSATFGGVPRARVSSQCWKRAIRKLAAEESTLFCGCRSKLFMSQMANILLSKKDDFKSIALYIIQENEEKNKNRKAKDKDINISKMFDKLKLELDDLTTGKKAAAEIVTLKIFETAQIKFDEDGEANNLFYFSDGELQAAVQAYLAESDAKKAVAAAVKQLEKVTKDGVDIAFFGRMIASTDLTLEGAASFSHAISTHVVNNDIDFFTAVDDLKPSNVTRSSHMGDLEFNTACYYRYVGLNLDLLADARHLGALTLDERREAVRRFLDAVLNAFPQARKNAMFSQSCPGFVLGIARRGQPLSLTNAFERPVRSNDGFLDESAKRLQDHWESLKITFGIASEKELQLPGVSLKALAEGLSDYVK